LAGCAGSSSSSDSSSGGPTTGFYGSASFSAGPSGANATVSAGYSTGTNGTTNRTTAATWTTETRHGNVSGLALIGSGPSQTESFTVANGTLRMVLNLTVQGDDLTLSLRAPGCTSAACAKEVTTSGGSASMAVDNPPQGGWEAHLQPTASKVGPVQSSYTLTIAKQVKV
jgi:hypothetical protein